MKNKLLIIGASGHGKVIAEIALKMNKWQYIAFLDDNETINSSMGIEVIGNSNQVTDYINDFDIFVGIGNNITRQKIHHKLLNYGATIPILVHPSAIIGEQVEIGEGTAIMAGVVINCCTKIGNGCIVNTGATIDHDNIIENFVHISPGAKLAGTIKVGQGSWLGIGCVISNNVNITEFCTVGAGAVVVKDIIVPGIYIGVPVRKKD